jgi:hypothetical protein
MMAIICWVLLMFQSLLKLGTIPHFFGLIMIFCPPLSFLVTAFSDPGIYNPWECTEARTRYKFVYLDFVNSVSSLFLVKFITVMNAEFVYKDTTTIVLGYRNVLAWAIFGLFKYLLFPFLWLFFISLVSSLQLLILDTQYYYVKDHFCPNCFSSITKKD